MSETKHIVQEAHIQYEKSELDMLRAALNRTYKERFLMATTLYKVQQTLKKAKITHQPFKQDK